MDVLFGASVFAIGAGNAIDLRAGRRIRVDLRDHARREAGRAVEQPLAFLRGGAASNTAHQLGSPAVDMQVRDLQVAHTLVNNSSRTFTLVADGVAVLSCTVTNASPGCTSGNAAGLVPAGKLVTMRISSAITGPENQIASWGYRMTDVGAG